jgi:polyisoprenyl-teichoic acid--peptidoglycan teichoic acid transferase
LPGQVSRRERRLRIDAGFRRALGLTALSALVPGAGLTRTRSRKAGWTILALAVLTGAAAAYGVIASGATTDSSTPAKPTGPTVLVVAVAAAALLWCGAIVLTAVRSRPVGLDRARTGLLTGLTTLLVVLVAASMFTLAELAALAHGWAAWKR